MRQTSKGEGTKIAQAAKDLNVTSVTIRRYLAEFDIATTSDENGVKVLPPSSMEELKEIRKLKEDGLTNPKVMEILEELRSKAAPKGKVAKEKDGRKESAARTPAKASKAAEVEPEDEEQAEEEEEQKPSRPAARRIQKPEKGAKSRPEKVAVAEVESSEEEQEEQSGDIAPQVRAKHSLTCQTCGKVFEHMNPRLRDCLDCYRTKRKERRRGGSDRHKNVIQHPLAQQAVTKSAAQQQQVQSSPPQTAVYSPPAHRTSTVRNYRKAIEETRGLTSNLKRRLERPDLPEGERRWLEQIYAYQLILHQGWRHLAEYKSANQQKGDRQHAQSSSSEREGPNANGY